MYNEKVDEVCLLELDSLDTQILHLPRYLSGCMILGGAPLALYLNKKELINDWDLFFTTHVAQNTARAVLDKLDFKLIDETVNSYTYINDKTKVQIIKYLYISPLQAFEHFDLTVCCIGVVEDCIVMEEHTRKDIDALEFNIIAPTDPTGLIERIIRYGIKGFKPSLNCLQDIVRFLQNTDIEMREYRRKAY